MPNEIPVTQLPTQLVPTTAAYLILVQDGLTYKVQVSAVQPLFQGPPGEQGEEGPQGEQGPPGADQNYVHVQGVAATTWIVNHNLGKYPAVIVIDSSNRQVYGSIEHNSINQATIGFAAAFSGKAICN